MTTRTATLLLGVWLASTVPMIFFGYGSDNDCWLVARAADRIWQTGEYVRSRSTGFPLHELSVAPLVHAGGWYLSNALSTLGGLAILLALIRLARKQRLRHPVLSTVAIAFAPVVVVNSASTIDYVPALALLMWSYVLVMDRRYLGAAALTGLACGFRPTSGLFVIPVIVYLIRSRESVGAAVKYAGISLVVGVLAYSPALIRYGFPDASTPFTLKTSTLFLIGGYRYLGLFGILQTAILVPVLGHLMWRSTEKSSPFFLFHLTNILLWSTLFIFMPLETAYLLPMLPSVVLLLDRYARHLVMIATVVVMLMFHVVQIDLLGGESGQRSIQPSLRPGMTVMDIQDRWFKLSTRNAASTLTVDRPTVFFFGVEWIPTLNKKWFYDEEQNMYGRYDTPLFVSSAILDQERLRRLKENGRRLFVWDGAKWEYVRLAGSSWRDYVEVVYDLDEFFGQDIKGRPLTER